LRYLRTADRTHVVVVVVPVPLFRIVRMQQVEPMMVAKSSAA
jgi:hypothetical protein